jgi:hypothetical protein
MERDKVHLDEVLCLPFFLPCDVESPSPNAEALLRQVVGKMRGLQSRMAESAANLAEELDTKSFKLRRTDEGEPDDERKKWLKRWATKTVKVQEEIEPLLYEYFGLIGQERALVEDTWNIFDRSDTPGTLDTPIPTLEPLDAAGLDSYASIRNSR